MLDPELEQLIGRLFSDARVGAARAVFGAGAAAFGKSWQEGPLSRAVQFSDRLILYERDLIAQVELLADLVPEFEGEDLDRLESGGIALLIAIRELRRHFPELGDKTRADTSRLRAQHPDGLGDLD